MSGRSQQSRIILSKPENARKNKTPKHIAKGITMTDESLDYESLWKLYSPQPRNWFSGKIIYQGWGVATFENPAGTIEGPTKIVVDEFGEMKIEMKYKKLNTAVTVYGTGDFKFIKFAQGNIGSKKTENMIGLGTGNSNPCSKLTVQTKTGMFTSAEKVFCSEGLGTDGKFRFYISQGTFEITSSKPAKYWVVPLINFFVHISSSTTPYLGPASTKINYNAHSSRNKRR